MKKSTQAFILYLVVFIVQELINYIAEDSFFLGLIPAWIFVFIWTLQVSKPHTYQVTDLGDKYNSFRMWIVILIAVALVELPVINIMNTTAGNPVGLTNIMIVQVIVSVFLVIGAINVVNYLGDLIKMNQNIEGLRFKIFLAWLFFPVGIFWLQPKIDKAKEAPTAANMP